jgi:CDGSH-type Zn-finger protein
MAKPTKPGLGRIMADEVVIRVTNNGPYRVEGPVKIVDADGNEIDTTGKARISLCRCGGSTTKPFCDGTHSKIGFQGALAAVKAAEDSTER